MSIICRKTKRSKAVRFNVKTQCTILMARERSRLLMKFPRLHCQELGVKSILWVLPAFRVRANTDHFRWCSILEWVSCCKRNDEIPSMDWGWCYIGDGMIVARSPWSTSFMRAIFSNQRDHNEAAIYLGRHYPSFGNGWRETSNPEVAVCWVMLGIFTKVYSIRTQPWPPPCTSRSYIESKQQDARVKEHDCTHRSHGITTIKGSFEPCFPTMLDSATST